MNLYVVVIDALLLKVIIKLNIHFKLFFVLTVFLGGRLKTVNEFSKMLNKNVGYGDKPTIRSFCF
jgi:hypothetical protein